MEPFKRVCRVIKYKQGEGGGEVEVTRGEVRAPRAVGLEGGQARLAVSPSLGSRGRTLALGGSGPVLRAGYQGEERERLIPDPKPHEKEAGD